MERRQLIDRKPILVLSRSAVQPAFEEQVSVEQARNVLETAKIRVPDGKGGAGTVDTAVITRLARFTSSEVADAVHLVACLVGHRSFRDSRGPP